MGDPYGTRITPQLVHIVAASQFWPEAIGCEVSGVDGCSQLHGLGLRVWSIGRAANQNDLGTTWVYPYGARFRDREVNGWVVRTEPESLHMDTQESSPQPRRTPGGVSTVTIESQLTG